MDEVGQLFHEWSWLNAGWGLYLFACSLTGVLVLFHLPGFFLEQFQSLHDSLRLHRKRHDIDSQEVNHNSTDLALTPSDWRLTALTVSMVFLPAGAASPGVSPGTCRRKPMRQRSAWRTRAVGHPSAHHRNVAFGHALLKLRLSLLPEKKNSQ